MLVIRAGRRALSIIEVVVVIAILAILTGLLMAAVQRARAEAVRVQSANKLRQIIIATHGYAANRSGMLPGYTLASSRRDGSGIFEPILPFLEGDNFIVPNPHDMSGYSFVPAYMSPADLGRIVHTNLQTTQLPDGSSRSFWGDHSYPANLQLFQDGANLPRSLSDGLSTTIAFGERYAICNQTSAIWRLTTIRCIDPVTGAPRLCVNPVVRRPTFADPDVDDVVPVTENGVTRPSVAGVTFQIVPSLGDCDYRVPQTPHSGGMLTAFADGSVRTIRRGVSEQVFWSAVTPAGGESIGEP